MGLGRWGLRIERDRAPKALNSARIASYNIHIFKWRSPNIYIIGGVFGVMKRGSSGKVWCGGGAKDGARPSAKGA